MGNSQSVSSIAASSAREAEIRAAWMSGPKIEVPLPEELVHRWANLAASEMLKIDIEHPLVKSCRKALGRDI